MIAEDDPNDVFLLRRAFRKAGLGLSVEEVHNGQEAIDYLGGKGAFVDRGRHPFPALLFLDLKMPLLDGFDVLRWLSCQPIPAKPPVIVLTSSNQESDIARAREMGADEYRIKPHHFDELVQIVKEVHEHWLIGNRAP